MQNKFNLVDSLIVCSLGGAISTRFLPGFNILYDLGTIFTLSIILLLFLKNYKEDLNFNKRYLILILCLFLYILIGYYYSVDKDNLLLRFSTIIQFFILAYFIMLFIINTKKIHKLPFYFMYSGIFALCVIYFMTDDIIGSKVGSDIVGANGLAYVLLFSLISSLYLNIYYGKIYIVHSLFIFSNMILTGSRQVIVTIIVLGIVIIFFKNLSLIKKPKLFLGITISTMICFLLYTVFNQYIPDRIIELFSTNEVQSSGRSELIYYGLIGFLEKPLFGHGFMNYEYYIETMYGTLAGYAHNNYVELLFDLGLFGLIIYYFPYLVILYKYITNYKYMSKDKFLNYLILCLIALLIEDIFTMGMKFALQYLIVGITYYYIYSFRKRVL